MFSCEFQEVSKNTYSYRTPPVAAFACSRNLEFEKQTDQNFITQNLHHGKEYYIPKKKKLLKQCKKEIIYEYILAFAGWWSFVWEVVGGGGYILADGGWWCICFGCWSVVVGGGVYILAGGGWWWVVAQFNLTPSEFPQKFIVLAVSFISKDISHPVLVFSLDRFSPPSFSHYISSCSQQIFFFLLFVKFIFVNVIFHQFLFLLLLLSIFSLL